MSPNVNRTKRNSLESEYLEETRRANELEEDEKPEAAASTLKQAARIACDRAKCARSDADRKKWLQDARDDLEWANQLSDETITEDSLNVDVDLPTAETGTSDSAPEGDDKFRSEGTTIPEVSFDDIGGLDDEKYELRKAVEWPLRYPETFAENNINAPAGVLLFGPPGTGKTLMAKAVANETAAAFYQINGPEIFQKYLGKSEEAIRQAFTEARECDAGRAVLYIDELDSISTQRGDSSNDAADRVVNQILTELDGLNDSGDLIVIGSTNRPDEIDDALLRSGRLGTHIRVPIPDAAGRREILAGYTQQKPLGPNVDLTELVEATEGYTGSDIEKLANEAAQNAMEKEIRRREVSDPISFTITHDDFVNTLEGMTPSTSEKIKQCCDEFEGDNDGVSA